ncbi:hypothetical protein BH10BAC5_BH10BAC5_07490 [soil metagenome]
MKKLLLILLLMVCFHSANSAPFTINNLVIIRVGDGTALTSAAYPVFLDEYTPAGVFVQTVALPVAVSGGNLILTQNGNSTSEGFLQLSLDGQYLVIPGYNAIPGTLAVSGTSTTGGTPVLRVFGLVDAAGNVNTTNGTEAFSGGNIRSVTTVDGTYFYAAGSNSGVRYQVAGGAPNSSVQLSTTPTNNRVVKVFNTSVYISSASGTFQGVYNFGPGFPTTAGQTSTILPGFPVASGPSPYDFAMSPDGNTIYVADDRAVASGGGIQKWTFSAGSWTLNATFNTGLTTGCRGVTVNWLNGTGPILYATSSGGSANTFVTALDNGAPTFTVLATAPANYVYRGIAFTPNSITPVELGSFTSIISNNNVQLNWRTENEQNNSRFVIERKSANSDWSSVGTVSGAGNSSTVKNYTFSDVNIASGTYHYRLNQIDFNGNHKYYDLSNEVIVGVPSAFSLSQNFPNPFNPSTTINYSLPADSRVDLKVFDMSGKEVSSLVNGNQAAGYYSINFNAAGLSSGIYFYRLTANGNNVNYSNTMRMILVK